MSPCGNASGRVSPGVPATAMRLALLLAAVCLFGCKSARVEQPLTGNLSGSDPETQMEFWHSLAEQRVVSNDDALHAMLLFLDGQDPAADYQERVRLLTEKGLLCRFDEPAEEAVTRGTVAVMLVKALEIKGGLIMRLVGPAPRYAVRELEYKNLFPPSATFQTFSGAELLDVISRAEDYQRVQMARAGRKAEPAAPGGNAGEPQAQPQVEGEAATE